MKSCKIDGCIHKPIQIKNGYCANHYYANMKYGDPLYRSRAYNGGAMPKYLYKIFMHMHERCYDKSDKQYKDYGGRGITICDEWNKNISGWKAFENFKRDVGERPEGRHRSGKPLYSLDRIDNNKGYSPDNVRWATYYTQNGNTRKNNTNVGVVYDKSRDKWKARLTIMGVNYLDKRFNTYDEAVKARKDAELKYSIKGRY